MNDAISCLREVKGELRIDAPINLIAAYFYKKLIAKKISHDEIMNFLNCCSFTREMTSETEEEIAAIEDEWCLAEDGVYGNVDDVKKELKMFLEKRKDYIAHLPME